MSNEVQEQAKKEHAVLRRYAAIQKATEEKIGCQKVYVDIAGGIEEAFVLDELIYFTLPRPNGISGLRVWKQGVLWMAVSRSEWWERKRMTPKQADGAIERLVKDGLVIKCLFLFNKQKTTHLRLNVAEFLRRYSEFLNKENPPENGDDTMTKDISDLYEMMGIPKRDTPEGIPDGEGGILKRETVSLKGNSLNTPHTPSTQPIGVPPEFPIEWQIGNGVEELSQPDEELSRRIDFANLVAIGTSNPTLAREIAMTFQNTRNITLPESKVKGQRKAIKEMLEMGVNGSHVTRAVYQLKENNMTITDLFSVSKTAIDLANTAEIVTGAPKRHKL